MNLDELDELFAKSAEYPVYSEDERHTRHCARIKFNDEIRNNYPSLSAKVRESEKQIAALTAERDALQEQPTCRKLTPCPRCGDVVGKCDGASGDKVSPVELRTSSPQGEQTP